jgi:nucleoside-diphosphate-sugar epimerase
MRDDLILVAGAGGFIGGHLVRYLLDHGRTRVRAVDNKPLISWYQKDGAAENLRLDLSVEENCERACHGVADVYNLACDMGGMGFIEKNRVACLRSVLINTHLIESAWRSGARRYFYASSACAYNTELQAGDSRPLREEDAYPALPERGYGWEKIMGEQFCREYHEERGLQTFIARLHNVYGPHGTWTGGREKAPAAVCRKVLEAIERRDHKITIWGDGEQVRSFMYISDCMEGIDRIINCPALVGRAINLGSSESVTINGLVDVVEKIAGVTLERAYDKSQPRGVDGRNSDNTLIREIFGWEPSIALRDGMEKTYDWIKRRYEQTP